MNTNISSNTMLRPVIFKVSVLDYFPLYILVKSSLHLKRVVYVFSEILSILTIGDDFTIEE